MLVLTRRVGETLVIGDGIKVTVTAVTKGRARIGVTAPKEVPVVRLELARPSANACRHIQVERESGRCVVRLRKTRLEEAEVHQLGDELLALAQKEGRGRVVLSLGPQPPDCLYSVFLAKLIAVRNAARRNGGDLVLCNVSQLAYSVFEACQLHREFIFRPDVASAISYFNPPSAS